jgi:putative acetyltransferase
MPPPYANRTIWSAWINGKLAGCGALKELDVTHGEIKSMRTARTHLRQGVAAGLLTHILAIAKRRGYSRISLETGTPEAFARRVGSTKNSGFSPAPRLQTTRPGPSAFA